jgi:hypothetical protein
VAKHKSQELNSMKLLDSDDILNCKKERYPLEVLLLNTEVDELQKRNSRERRLCSIS